jgi:hypothetical protein
LSLKNSLSKSVSSSIGSNGTSVPAGVSSGAGPGCACRTSGSSEITGSFSPVMGDTTSLGPFDRRDTISAVDATATAMAAATATICVTR